MRICRDNDTVHDDGVPLLLLDTNDIKLTSFRILVIRRIQGLRAPSCRLAEAFDDFEIFTET